MFISYDIVEQEAKEKPASQKDETYRKSLRGEGWMSIPPSDFAEQMSIFDLDQFCSIPPSEFYYFVLRDRSRYEALK